MQKCVVLTMEEYTSLCVLLHDAAIDLKIADIARDGQLLQYVRNIASDIVDEDPNGILPQNEILWKQLQSLRKTHVNWAAIS